PFWLGEAPARTHELSVSVSRLREEVADRVDVSPGEDVRTPGVSGGPDDGPPAHAGGSDRINLDTAIKYLTADVGISRAAAVQIVEYLAGAKAVLGIMPSQD